LDGEGTIDPGPGMRYVVTWESANPGLRQGNLGTGDAGPTCTRGHRTVSACDPQNQAHGPVHQQQLLVSHWRAQRQL